MENQISEIEAMQLMVLLAKMRRVEQGPLAYQFLDPEKIASLNHAIGQVQEWVAARLQIEIRLLAE